MMSADPSRFPDRLPPGWLDRSETKRSVLAELSGRSAQRGRRRRRLLAATTTCAVLLLATAGAWWSHPKSKPVSLPATAVVTPPTRNFLPDGSIVERKSDAAYTVQFTDAVRRVTLTSGTAHFDVVSNPERPFVVTAGGVNVRAVGTAFSVEFNPVAVEVLVTEGRVEVVPTKQGDEYGKATTVDAGRGVVVDFAASAPGHPPVIHPVPAQTMEKKLSWRIRLVEFGGTPLAEVVETLNKHNRVQFSIADAELAKVKLSGVIRVDRISGVVRLLEEEGSVRAERRGDSEIVLHRAR